MDGDIWWNAFLIWQAVGKHSAPRKREKSKNKQSFIIGDEIDAPDKKILAKLEQIGTWFYVSDNDGFNFSSRVFIAAWQPN